MIREVVKATGDIITVAGTGTSGYSGDGGPATDAESNTPAASPSTPAGDLFIADTATTGSARWSNRPVTSSPSPATVPPVTAGDNGPATGAELNFPYGVAVDAVGDLFIVDSGNNAVREVVKATGDIITVAGNGTAGYSGDNGPATAAEMDNPGRVAFDSAGDMFIADSWK